MKPPKLTEREAKRNAESKEEGNRRRKSKTKLTSRNNQEAFLLRLDQQVNASRRRTEYKAGKQAYDAKVTKRACPQCGRFQSYDEVIKKKKRCSDCRRTYAYPVVWKDVREGFIYRNVDAGRRAHATYHKQCKGTRTAKAKVSWNTVREEFLARMAKASKSKAVKQQDQVVNKPNATSASKQSQRKRRTANRMNYSMYVEGCTANSLPAHVERVLGKGVVIDMHSYLEDLPEEESPEWARARELVLSRLKKHQR